MAARALGLEMKERHHSGLGGERPRRLWNRLSWYFHDLQDEARTPREPSTLNMIQTFIIAKKGESSSHVLPQM